MEEIRNAGAGLGVPAWLRRAQLPILSLMSVRQFPARTLALGAVAVATAASTVAIVAVTLWHILTNAYDATGDFLSFYAAGYLAQTGHASDLYTPSIVDATQRLLYPGRFGDAIGYPLPVFVAWLFAPLSLLPFTAAFLLYLTMTAALLAGLLYLLHGLLAAAPRDSRWLFLACATLALPTLATVVSGQVDLIALAGLIAGYRLLRAERRALAGVLLCLVLVKPHLLAGVALFLVLRREWRTAGVVAGVGLPLLVLPALLASSGTLVDNVRAMVRLDDQLLAGSRVAVMASWRGFIASVTNSDRLAYWAPGTVVIAAGAIAVAVSRWRDAAAAAVFDRDYSLAVLLPLLISPHVHSQTLVVGLLPAALALRAYLGRSISREAARRAADAILLGFTLLFAFPFLAIQGLSLTVFLVLAAYLAAAVCWPGQGTSKQDDIAGSRGGPPLARGLDQEREAA